MEKEEIVNLIRTSYEAKPSEFQQQTADILNQRVMDALQRRRDEIAQSLFNEPEEVPDVVDVPDEVEPEINSDDTDTSVDQTEEPNGQDA